MRALTSREILILAGPNGAGKKHMSKVTDHDLDWFLAATEAALIRAAKRARQIAVETGTRLIVSEKGKVVAISPEELARADKQPSPGA